jgi:hypothetical protein
MELLQWMNSGARIVLTGVFALLPGTLIWLSLAAAVTFLRKRSRVQALRALGARLHQA